MNQTLQHRSSLSLLLIIEKSSKLVAHKKRMICAMSVLFSEKYVKTDVNLLKMFPVIYCKLKFLLQLDFKIHSKQNKKYFTMQDFEEINPHLKDHSHLEV